jgi:hypothetical protein
MARPMPQCVACARYLSPLDRDDNQPPDDDASGGAAGQVCGAFPDGIPDVIWANRADHRQPFPGDNGLQWESNGQPFPGFALDLGPP